MFAHSYMCLLPPSLAPCLSSPPHLRSLLHTRSPAHYPYITPALPIAHVLWQILLTCQKGRTPRASLQKAACTSRWSGLVPLQPRCSPRRAKLKDEATLWRKGLMWTHGPTPPVKASFRYLSPLERQHAHHQASPSTGSKPIFQWAKRHI